MEKNNVQLTILMPCLNEEQTLGYCIEEAKCFLEKSGIRGEILVADNMSTDQSAEIAKKRGARVTTVRKKGYGNALRIGIEESNGRYIVMGDCDGSYDFLHLEAFVEKLDEGYDLVMGNRFNKEMEAGAMPFAHKYLGVPFLSWLGRRVYHTTIYDFHCGIRGMKRESIIALRLQSEGMEFASEMIGEAVREKLRIAEVDTIFRRDKRNHRSHMRPVRDGLRHVFWILRR